MAIRIWSYEQEDILKEKYPTTTVEELMAILPFTDAQIRKKAKLLKLIKNEDSYKFAFWNDEDIQLLKANYDKMTNKELANLFNGKFNESQITGKLFRMGLSKSNKWDDEMLRYLLDNYQSMSIKEMREDKLNSFSERSIYKKLNALGAKLNTANKWTKNEIEILKKYYPIRTNKEMLEYLPHLTIEQIKSKAQYLGIKKIDIVVYKAKSVYSRDDKWTDKELSILIEHYGKIPNKKIIELYLPNRSLNSLKIKAKKMNLSDKLRYQFLWEVVNTEYTEEYPSEINITIKKRRADKC